MQKQEKNRKKAGGCISRRCLLSSFQLSLSSSYEKLAAAEDNRRCAI